MTPRGEKSSLAFGVRRSTTFLRFERLIELATRGLSKDDYSEDQIEAALGTALGVDSQLVRDGTYFVAEAGRSPVACGGWSSRKTLFGSDGKGRLPAGVVGSSARWRADSLVFRSSGLGATGVRSENARALRG